MSDHLIEIMSPATLASFIADVECLGMGASAEALESERKARKALIALIGKRQAERMIRGEMAYTP